MPPRVNQPNNNDNNKNNNHNDHSYYDPLLLVGHTSFPSSLEVAAPALTAAGHCDLLSCFASQSQSNTATTTTTTTGGGLVVEPSPAVVQQDAMLRLPSCLYTNNNNSSNNNNNNNNRNYNHYYYNSAPDSHQEDEESLWKWDLPVAAAMSTQQTSNSSATATAVVGSGAAANNVSSPNSSDQSLLGSRLSYRAVAAPFSSESAAAAVPSPFGNNGGGSEMAPPTTTSLLLHESPPSPSALLALLSKAHEASSTKKEEEDDDNTYFLSGSRCTTNNAAQSSSSLASPSALFESPRHVGVVVNNNNSEPQQQHHPTALPPPPLSSSSRRRGGGGTRSATVSNSASLTFAEFLQQEQQKQAFRLLHDDDGFSARAESSSLFSPQLPQTYFSPFSAGRVGATAGAPFQPVLATTPFAAVPAAALRPSHHHHHSPYSNHGVPSSQAQPQLPDLDRLMLPMLRTVTISPLLQPTELPPLLVGGTVYVHRVQHKRRVTLAWSSTKYALHSALVVDGDRGVDIGTVSDVMESVFYAKKDLPAAFAYRLATPQEIAECLSITKPLEQAALLFLTDLARIAKIGGLAGGPMDYLVFASEIAMMNFTDVELQADHKMLSVYFTAPRKITFCHLSRRLYQMYRCRVWLHQTNVGNLGGEGSSSAASPQSTVE